MTTPTTVSSRYSADSSAFRQAKVARDGSVRMETFTLSVADAASVGTFLGLVPFRKGARFVQNASTFHVTDLDTGTSVTLNFGYIYDDHTNNTNDPDAFASALSAQAAGLLTLDEHAGLTWEAAADGWISAQVQGGAVTTAGTLKGQVAMSYDPQT